MDAVAAPPEPASAVRGSVWVWFVAAMALALAIRLPFHAAYAPRDLPFADGLWYHGAANLLADGKGLIDPLAYSFQGRVQQSAGHPPLFVFVLAFVSALGGTSTGAHQLTELALDVLAVGAIGLLGREVAGDRVGVVAAFGAAVFPRFWASEGEILSESLFGLLVAVVLLLSFRLLRRPSLPLAGALGATIGLVTLTRAEGIMYLPLLVLPVVVMVRQSRTSRVRLLGAAVVGTLVVIGPWTAYNATRFDRPVPVSTGLGAVVAGANCDRSYYGGDIGYWNAACTASRGRVRDESVHSDVLRDRGLRYAADHVARFPVVVAARVARLVEVYDPRPATFGPEWAKGLLLAGWYLAVPVAIAGAFVARRRGISIVPFVAIAIAVVLNAALTWGTPRFRGPLDITVVVLAAIAIDALVLRWARGRRPAPAQPPEISEGAIPR
ncbi:MAG: glycosyltransferase family 39 protein [Acidimicrobiia bacterium]